MISVQDISVSKGKKLIVKLASLEVEPGKISVLIGNNGAGKSTLFEAVAGVNPLSKGSIQWDGQAHVSFNHHQLAQRRAVLSQKVDVAFSLKVKKLVEMGAYVSDNTLSNEQIDGLVERSLEKVGLKDFQHRIFFTLSGGEQKRALLAKCMVQLDCCQHSGINQYLFLDEPTANLDVQQQYKLMKLVKKLAKDRKIGVLAVLHDINLASQMGDEILMMKEGKVVQRGKPWEVITVPLLNEILGIHATVQPHPIWNCPYVTYLPHAIKQTDTSLNTNC